MKKRNKPTKLYWLIPLIVAVLWFTVGAKAGIVQNSTSGQTGQDSISIGFDLLDSLGNPVIVDSAQDWGCMITYYPGGLVAVVDSFLLDGTTNAQVRWNANHFRGLQSWNYRRQISDLDGTPVNGTYSYRFIVRDSSLHLFTTYRGEFTVYQTAEFATVLNQIKYDTDSLVFGATLDNPSFLSPTTASRTLDVTATGEAGIDLDNTAGTLAKTTDITGFNDIAAVDPWNVSYGTAFTGGSMGDSLNGMQYSKVSQLIVANVDAAISSRGTSNLTATDNIGINWADVSNPTSTVGLTNTTVGIVTTLTNPPAGLDSAVVSRINRRMWGVQLGAAGSTDSLTIAQRLVDATRISGDATAADNAELFFDGTGYAGTNNVIPTVTTTTNLTNAPTNGDLTATMKTSVSAATWGAATSSYVGAGTFGNMANRDSIRIKEIIDSLDTQAWASTSAGSGVDSAVVSRILRRMWGIQLGAAGSTDSVTYSQRLAALIFIDSLVRKGLGDTVATFGDSAVLARSVWDNDVVALASRTTTVNALANNVITSASIADGGITDADVADDVKVDANSISTSALAATNLEAAFDTDSSTVAPRLQLRQLEIQSNATNSPAIYLKGVGTGPGLSITGGASSSGASIVGAANQDGLLLSSGATTGYGLTLTGTSAALSGQLTSSNFAAGAITANAIADLAIDSNTFALDARKMIAIRADSGAAGGTGLDSATTSRIVKRTVWGVGGGSSGSDSTTLAQRTATATGTVTADVYPLLGPKFVVDAVGADGNSQFVVDTVSLGVFSSDQDAIINRTIIIRSLSGDEVSLPTTINRVAYTGANCSLTVNIDAPKNFAANDTIQFTGLPWHDFATVAEASDSNALALLAADTTGLGGDATVGGAIVAEGSDTTKQKLMLQNMGLKTAIDSVSSLSETATSDGTLRRGEIVTARAAAETTMVILDRDSILTRGGIIDSVTYTDTLGSQVESDITISPENLQDIIDGVAAGINSLGTGIYALTIYAIDTVNSTPVQGALVVGRAGATTVSGNTNDSGRITFNVDSASWTINAYGSPYTWVPFSRTVNSNITDTITGGGVTVVATASPGMCTVYGQIDRNGVPAQGVWVDISLTRPDTLTIDSVYIDIKTRVVTNSSGVWSADVYYLTGSTRNFYYTYKDAYGRILYFRPTTSGSLNVKNITIDKP